ncbi:neurogenic protein mastermind [Nilaparvata lugens]|uniref:neurogenic protein mastermind n=1 Tax=Nilaparvata lugens TaxID=108931 RepID=UPI00193E9AB4|nr:neurogenic protein mastermind [Nilaparvata lugens]
MQRPGTQGDVLPPKRQAVVDRLRRRIENYRRHSSGCVPKFDQTFNSLVEQNFQDTLVLKQRFLENKAKRAAKKTDKKTPENNLQSNAHPVSKLMSAKRPADEPPQPPQQPQPPPTSSASSTASGGAEGLTKFSVEIVQQLEFTTCSSSSQISTNVTVKALNTSVKSAQANPPSSRPAATPEPPHHHHSQHQQSGHQQGSPMVVSCKQELDEYPEFVDLDQCAAALEKDAAANGHTFTSFSDLIGDDTSDAIITSDTFKDLINEISDYPSEFMKDFADYDGGVGVDIKPHIPSSPLDELASSVRNSSSYGVGGGAGGGAGLPTELSPAAHTLKQMAEHHQHKAQMGMGFGASAPPPRGKPQPPGGAPVPQPPTIKQEVMYGSPGGSIPPTPPTPGRPMGGYSPYGGSPRGGQQGGAGGGAPPPRPSSGPTPPTPQQQQGGATTLQISQAQQLHITNQGQPIQVSMAQNMSTDVKQQASSVSVAAHQGLFFSQHPHHSHPSPGSPSPSNPTSHPPQPAPPPPHSSSSSSSVPPPPNSSSSSSFCGSTGAAVSQSQTINFTQQTMRLRPTANLLRAQPMMTQQQPQVRPPPPDYQSQMHSMLSNGMAGHRPPQPQPHPHLSQPQPHLPQSQPHLSQTQPHHGMPQMRFASAPLLQQRRMSQQPMPPSGPMMRPQQMPTSVGPGFHMSQQQQVYQSQQQSQQLNRAQQLAQLIDSPAEWRQHQIMMAQHQQQQQQQQQPRPQQTFHQAQGVSFSGGGLQLSAAQEQVLPPHSVASGLPRGQQLAMQHSMPPHMSLNLNMTQQQHVGGQQFGPGNKMQQHAGGQFGSAAPGPNKSQQHVGGQQFAPGNKTQQHLGGQQFAPGNKTQQHVGGQQFGAAPGPNRTQQHVVMQQQHLTAHFGGGGAGQFGGYVPNSTGSGFQAGATMSAAAFQSSSMSSGGGVQTTTSSSSSSSSQHNPSSSSASSYGPPQLPSDLNLDFLEQLPSDSSQMDLLNSLESAGASFNLHDIL